MRTFFTILLSMVFLGTASLALAKPEGKGHQGKPQAAERISGQGAANTNSPASGDQEKGLERAEERQAVEHPNQGNHAESGRNK